MSDDTQSKELTVPEEPWMSHGFISKVASQVSLPYRKPKTKEIERRNGSLLVRYATTEDCLPYGKYPRLFELWACTMIKSYNDCFDPERNVLHLGTTFREFLRMIGIEVGGKSLKTIKPQLERLFACKYYIKNESETESKGYQFVVAREWRIDWLQDEPQERGLFENWVRLDPDYVAVLKDHPVPVSLEIVSKLSSPMSIDVYWWLTKRYYGMRERVSVTWRQLYNQFGSETRMTKFRESFKRAVAEVLRVYPQARITCGREYVTLYPSETSVATVMQARSAERRQGAPKAPRKAAERPETAREASEGHWIDLKGLGRVWWTSEAFNAADAQNHLLGTVVRGACPVCRFDERNRELHESAANTLFD